VKADLIESLFPKGVGNDVLLTPDSIMSGSFYLIWCTLDNSSFWQFFTI